jgi:hypothetical protein
MQLVHDILDKPLKDRHDHPMGRVDGIILDVQPERPPRNAAIEVGLRTLAARLHPRLGRWFAWIEERWGPVASAPFRIPLEKVLDIGLDLKFDVVAEQTGARRWEHYLRRRIVEHIPGHTK